MTELGQLLKAAREELSRQLGREVIAEDVADEVTRLGAPIQRKTYSNIETGTTRTIKPNVANTLPQVIPVTVLQIVQAMGYAVAFAGIEGEEETEILEAWRKAKEEPAQRRSVRGALLLPPERRRDGVGRSLRRRLAMDRQGDQETQE